MLTCYDSRYAVRFVWVLTPRVYKCFFLGQSFFSFLLRYDKCFVIAILERYDLNGSVTTQ